jgi:hypothetical protein
MSSEPAFKLLIEMPGKLSVELPIKLVAEFLAKFIGNSTIAPAMEFKVV